MVFPGMVYISHPSEYGTLYTKNELECLSAVCREFNMPLFLDGARLGYGLTADTDVTLQDIAKPENRWTCRIFFFRNYSTVQGIYPAQCYEKISL